MFKKTLFFLCFFLFSLNSYSLDQVVIVDIDYLLNNSKAGKNIQEQLKKINDARIKEIKSKDELFKDKEAKLIAQKKILSEQEFAKKVNDLKKEVINSNSLRKKEMEQSNKKRNDAISKLLKEINQLLIEYSERSKISMMLDKKNVIISKNENDITKEILNLLDKKITKIKIN
tara:strand:- start:79 stop:597 length:519 start_codon:yes stop_codon:yes gene_type:complete